MEDALHTLKNAVLPRLEKSLSFLPEEVPASSLGELSFLDLVESVQASIDRLCEGHSLLPLDKQLESLAKVSRAGGIEVSYHSMGSEVHLDWVTIHECVRICQEACQNAIKHSGATELRLLAVISLAHITLTVVDNGVGCAGEGGSSMRERAREIRGVLTLEAQAEGGMVLVLVVPNEPQNHAMEQSSNSEALGKEIHDGICQELSVLLMLASHYRDESGEADPVLWRSYREITNLCSEACELARSLSHRLMGR